MLYDLECKYCGAKWTKQVYNAISKSILCYRCGDKDITIKEQKSNKADYYKGTPAFESAKKDDDDFMNWDGSD